MIGVRVLIFTMFLSVDLLYAKPESLPEEFPRCRLSDPNYDQCMTAAIQQAFDLLRKGIPSLGVQPIDPMEVSEISLGQGSGAVALALSFLNAKIIGFKDVKIIRTSNNLAQGGTDLRCDIFLPHFQILSDYKLKGRVLILPISGQGRSNYTLTDVKVRIHIENEIVTIDGDDYLKVKKFSNKVIPGDVHIDFQNLFNGDKHLGTEMNIFLNENSKYIFSEMSENIEETFGEIFKDISNKIFLKVPMKTIFPQ